MYGKVIYKTCNSIPVYFLGNVFIAASLLFNPFRWAILIDIYLHWAHPKREKYNLFCYFSWLLFLSLVIAFSTIASLFIVLRGKSEKFYFAIAFKSKKEPWLLLSQSVKTNNYMASNREKSNIAISLFCILGVSILCIFDMQWVASTSWNILL